MLRFHARDNTKPTIDDARVRIAQFNKENEQVEWLLTELFTKYPNNTNFNEVFLKTTVLNLLYTTNILAVNTVAQHIVGLSSLDTLLADGSPEAVRLIANVSINGKKFCFYSFATKYCSWHNQSGYPIFDRNVCACLRFYQKQDQFVKKFALDDLWYYRVFSDVLTKFRMRYGLEELNFKELDKFLYQHGAELLSQSGQNVESEIAAISNEPMPNEM